MLNKSVFYTDKFKSIGNGEYVEAGYTRRDIGNSENPTSILRCKTCNKFFTYASKLFLSGKECCPHCKVEFWNYK